MQDRFPLVFGHHLIVDQRDGTTYLSDQPVALDALMMTMDVIFDPADEATVALMDADPVLDAWLSFDKTHHLIHRYKEMGDIEKMLAMVTENRDICRTLRELGFQGPASHPWAFHEEPWKESPIVRCGPFYTIDQSLHHKNEMFALMRCIQTLDKLADEGVDFDQDLVEAVAWQKANDPYVFENGRRLWAEMEARHAAAEAEAGEQPEESPLAGIRGILEGLGGLTLGGGKMIALEVPGGLSGLMGSMKLGGDDEDETSGDGTLPPEFKPTGGL